jgi:hypothetical protein
MFFFEGYFTWLCTFALMPPGWPEARHRLDDLIDAKDEALRDLRDQLEHMRRDSERKDAIIMQMA